MLGAALAFGVTAAAGSGGPGQAGVGHVRVGQAIVVYPSATPIVRN